MAFLCAAMVAALTAAGPVQESRVPVLVELFTSEGCSSCPPADALLELLQRQQPIAGVEVIPVGLHVDYFNDLGWKDAFSAASFTARQRNYARAFGSGSLYTPQIVVDGRQAVIGSETELVRRAIAAAAARPHLPVRVGVQPTATGLRVSVDLPPAPARAEKITVMAAITEDGLSTVVKRGENEGRTLHHAAVARHVQRVGSLAAIASRADADLGLDRSWQPQDLKVVVWLEGADSRQVYGAGVCPYRGAAGR